MPAHSRSVRLVSWFISLVLLLALAAMLGRAVPASAAAAGRAGASARLAHGPLPLTAQRALAQAASSHRPVAIPGATTDTDALTANPNGSLTLTRSLVPVRVRDGHGWRSLDPALRRNRDGSLSATATSSPLQLSGGGSAPLAVMSWVNRSLAISLPMRLPAPSVSGATATYAGVLPGVDLVVTADGQGGFAETLVVHSATAAANPALRQLVLAVHVMGLKLAVGPAGDITANSPNGTTVFSAPTPLMWDSAVLAGTQGVTSPQTGQQVDAHTGMPLASTSAVPGEGAHIATVGTALQQGSIVLTPDARLLSSGSTVFPVYIDPTFNAPSAGKSRSSWTQVDSGFPTTSYWKESSLLQVGDCYDSPPGSCNGLGVARSFLHFSVPTAIYGSTVLTAQLNMTEEWSPSCTATTVQAWQTGGISSSTTWNNQPSWQSQQDSATVAHGFDSSCPAAGVGFDISGSMQSAANNSWSTVNFGIRASDESNTLAWKQFANTATMSITYDHTANQPKGLTMSPSSPCDGSLPLGDGNVSLYVPLSDPDGGTVGMQLQLWDTATNAAFINTPTDPQQLYVNSGSTAVFIAHKTDLEAVAGGVATKFSWKARATDFRKDSSGNYIYSSWSATCTFTFDPTRPGGPDVAPITSATIGQRLNVTINATASGTIPTDYLYQLNGGPVTTQTSVGADGSATLSIVPTRFTNTLAVTGQTSGGNVGDTANVVFNAGQAATAADSDLTGDNTADLLVTGSSANGLPPGIWLAPGQGNGQVQAGATDVGADGNSTAGDNAPSDFTSADVISGHFGGTGLQDLLAYYPNPPSGVGATAGQANILFGSGDGSAIQAQFGNAEDTIESGFLTDSFGDNPLQLVNAGDTSGQGFVYPDLLAINGDSLDGYYLEFYPDADGRGNYLNSYQLTTATPTGGSDWNNWTLATAQLSSGTAMYLWDSSTGALYLWTNLAGSFDVNSGTWTLSYTQYTVADGSTATWNKGAALSLQAADMNKDGVADLWASGPGGSVTGYLASLGSGSATLTPQPVQDLRAAAHAWALNDAASGAVSTAADSAGSLTLTAASGGHAAWNSGDLFDPDLSLDGAASTALATASPAINPAQSFTVSAWVNPAALGGTVLSQDMTSAASFRIYSDATAKSWNFCMAKSDSSSATWDCASRGGAQTGVWIHLTATYDASTGWMRLYQNGTLLDTGYHVAVTGTTGGGFQVGDYRSGSSHTGYFSGQVADVVTDSGALTPAQVATMDTGMVGPEGPITSGVVSYCMDDQTGGIADGAHIQLYQCNGTPPQDWLIASDGTIRVFNKCVTNSGGVNAAGNPVILSACVVNDASQQWKPGAGQSLQNPVTGKCLDDPGSVATNSTQLDIATCSSGANGQEWLLPNAGLDHAGALVSGVSSSKCIDDQQGKTTDGNKIQVYTCNGTAPQAWEVYPDGTLRVLGHCLDNSAGGSANGNLVQLWTCQGGNTNQQWLPVPGGYWTNPATHKCLDDPSGSTTNGTQLDLYTCNNTKPQVWPVPGTTVPGVPTAVSAAPSTTAGQATLSWTAPASNGGSAITGYTITASPGGATFSATGTSATVTGLTSGSAYTFTVTASTAAGTGAPSAPTLPVTIH